jgi:hypothetical protein
LDLKWIANQYAYHAYLRMFDIVPDTLLRQNARFRDLHRGERCFILGSGPSIKEQDLTRLKGQIVLTQNHFHAHEHIRTIAPSYHVVVPKYQPEEYDNDWIAWLRSMDERLPGNTVLFFGKNTRYLVDRLNLFQGRSYYMKTGLSPSVAKRAQVDITRTILAVPTVLTQCLAIAIYMGFREIILLGFDLDQVCRAQDRTKVRFYGLSPIINNKAEEDVEKSYAVSGNDWIHMWSIWRQCNLLKEEACRQGTRIVNATRGGLLNMFERQIYEEII